MIYVIADDLTGANDTGVQFAKNGYRTTVLIEDESLNIAFSNDYDVFVIDSETRGVEEKTARYRLNKILEGIDIHERDLVYKKIDSTMRGNVGAEIEEIMKILKKQICILSPSFPSHLRVTLGGHVLVQKKSLVLSEYIDSHLNKPEDSFIPSLLEKQTDLSIGRIDLLEVCKGQDAIIDRLNDLIKAEKKIIVVDSINEEHLRDIISGGMNFGGTVLFSGSAGLANYLAQSHGKQKNLKFNIPNNQGPILIVGGSKNPIMVEQINYLKSTLQFSELKIEIEKIYTQKSKILNDYANKCIKILQNNQDIVVYTDAVDNEEKSINNKIMQLYHQNRKELETEIKDFFGKLTSTIVKGSNIRNLILTGGDIAISVCRELNISNLKIMDELLPGIPLTGVTFKNQDLNIVTKAGGFGNKDTLVELVSKFRNDHGYSRVKES